MSHNIYFYAKCCYADCHYAECRYAECHYAEGHYAECHYAESHYADVVMLNVMGPYSDITPSAVMLSVNRHKHFPMKPYVIQAGAS